MSGTVRFRPRHRRTTPLITPSFILWCVAMVIVAAAAGVVVGLALVG